MSVHAVAGTGFDAGAGAYERSRPGYPRGALAPLGVGPGQRVVDVGAGTGKLTRELVAAGADVVAVEPVAGMRQQLRRAVPDARVAAGVAEALPLPDASADVVTVATAFHWFRTEEARSEIARVLRRGGRFALLWNRLVDEPSWWLQIDELVQAHRPDVPFGREERDWDAMVAAEGAFSPVQRHEVRWDHVTDAETLVAGSRSVSWIAALPGADQDEVARGVREVVRVAPEPLVLSERTEVLWCHKL